MRMFGFAARVSLAAFVCLGIMVNPANATVTEESHWSTDIQSNIINGNTLSFVNSGWASTTNITVVEKSNKDCTTNCNISINIAQMGSPHRNKFTLAAYSPNGIICAYAIQVFESNYTKNDYASGSFNCTGGLSYFIYTDKEVNKKVGTYTLEEAAPIVAPIISTGNCLLSDFQYAVTARWAGFTGPDLVTSIAVMFAESSGRVNALNQNTNGTFDIGLWQINDGAHPSYNRDLLGVNPAYNATAAFNIYTEASGFSPWVAFTTQRYTKYLARAETAINSTSASVGIVDCSGGIANTRDLDGDGITDTEDEESSCGFSVNPLKVLVCLFKPSAGSFTQWNGLQENAKSKPPLNVVTTAYGYTRGIVTTYNYCVNDIMQNCIETPDTKVNITQLTNGTSTVDPESNNFGAGIAFPVLTKAHELGESESYQVILGMTRYFMWGGFFWFVWFRVSKSFGARDTGKTEE